jgi:carboxymethylenebutenolidase
MNAHQSYLIEEFAEDYQAHRLSRRDLLRRTLIITGSIPATASVLLALGCGGDDDKGSATAVSPTKRAAADASAAATATSAPSQTAVAATAGVDAKEVRFKGPASDIIAYQALPSKPGAKFAAVVVVHENRGLNDHIRDIARRYAKEGFAALAVDLLSRSGGTKSDDNENSGLLGRANPDDLVADLVAAVNYLKAQAFVVPGSLGVTGFCFGGGYTFELAIASPDIKAAVPYYGTVRKLDDLAKTKAAILAIYGGDDTRVTASSEPVRQKLAESGKTVQVKVYAGANHAFFNDTGPRYNEAAAKDAWQITLDWFRRYLPTA